MSFNERSAKSTLVHYFRLAAAGGWRWDGDNQAEIEGAVESIIEAAQRPLLKRIEELEAKFEALESKGNIDFMTNLYKPE